MCVKVNMCERVSLSETFFRKGGGGEGVPVSWLATSDAREKLRCALVFVAAFQPALATLEDVFPEKNKKSIDLLSLSLPLSLWEKHAKIGPEIKDANY